MIALLAICAWFQISNHCALGLLSPAPEAEVHAQCHSQAPTSGDKPQSEEALPCCKVLRAVVAKADAVTPALLAGAFAYPVEIDLSMRDADQEIAWYELDTGPPPSLSFAELILQRSLLAHAPPQRA